MSRYFVGITGASGHAYAARLLAALVDAGHEVDLSISEAGCKVLRHELGVEAGERGERLADSLPAWLGPERARALRVFSSRSIEAPPSSGTSLTGGCILCPCSMGTLARVAAGYSSNLLERAADVALKEGRPLALVPRETPLSELHLENLLRLARMGAIVLPAMPGFYHRPSSIDDLVDHVVGKLLDRLGVEQAVGARWKGLPEAEEDPGGVSVVRRVLGLVKFSHSIFALPFALQGAWMASGGFPRAATLLWIVVCAVAARTAAMAFNRVADRRLDAANPRTAGRELPAGAVSVASAVTLVVVSAAVFVAAAFALNPLCGTLSLPVLGVLLGYSYVKRFSWLAHLVLGVSLAIAPLGAWLAVRGAVDGGVGAVLWLAAGVVAWVAGFDLIYACQDAEHDRRAELHSVPARFGIPAALRVSALLHVVAVGCFVAQGLSAGLGLAWWLAVGVAALLLAWEHRIVRPDDLSRVDLAFFTANGWVGVGLFVGLALDLGLRGGGL